MKKIINGKVYDTEKATEIGSHNNGYIYTEFSYCCETLYKKRTGEYFLFGDGGAMSKYAVHIGDNHWGGGQKIIPMTYDVAKHWAEENLDADEYQKEFGEFSEGEDVSIHIRIPADADNKLRTVAASRGVSITALVLEMIENL